MIPMKNSRRIASSILLFSIVLGITLTSATTENNYETDNNFLTGISETTHTENGYKTNIVINPHTTGIYAYENGYKLDLTINTQGIGDLLKENGYKLDLVPEKTFPDVPDVAVTKIATSKTIVGQGYTIIINVTVTNQALNYETFYVIIHANTTTIKTQTITLLSGNSATVISTWNTTAAPYGNYTISAYVWLVQGETNTADNNKTDGIIMVTIPGDVDGSFKVNYEDLFSLADAYGSHGPDFNYPGEPASPHWDPYCDFNGDNRVNYEDLFILADHYGMFV